MADRKPTLLRRVLAALPYALPVLGGLIGIAWINMTSHGSPILGIAGGALLGAVVAAVIVRLIEPALDARDLRALRADKARRPLEGE